MSIKLLINESIFSVESPSEQSTINNCSSERDQLIHLDLFLSSSHIVLATVGLPLNALVAGFLICFRRLRYKPQNVIWLGVTLSNLFTLLTIVIELWFYYTNSVIACLLFVSVTGIAYSCLLYNLLLALLERFALIKRSLWHQKRVTVATTIITQVAGCTVLILLIKWPLIIGFDAFDCRMPMLQAQILVVITVLLVFFCLVAQTVVYREAKQFINNNQTADGERGNSIPMTVAGMRNSASMNESNTSRNGSSDSNHLSRLEQEITWGLLIGVLSLICFTFPVLLLGTAEWICTVVAGDKEMWYNTKKYV